MIRWQDKIIIIWKFCQGVVQHADLCPQPGHGRGFHDRCGNKYKKALVWFQYKIYRDGKLDYFLRRKKSWGWHEDNVWLYQVRHRERMYLYEIILIIFAHNALLSKYWVPLCNHSDYVFIQLYQIQFYQIRYKHVEYLYVNIWLCFNCTQCY